MKKRRRKKSDVEWVKKNGALSVGGVGWGVGMKANTEREIDIEKPKGTSGRKGGKKTAASRG